MPLTREQFDKLDAEGFTPEEIASFEQKRIGEQQLQAFDPLMQQVQGAMQDPLKMLQMLQPFNPQTGMNVMGGLTRTAEAPIANLALNAQEGNFSPQGAAQAIGQGITGQRPGELGDVMRNAGVPEPIAALTGLLATMGVGGVGGKAGKVEQSVGAKVGVEADKLAGKVVNSLIKPQHRNFLFGKNPGRGISQEGIVATSMDDLLSKVNTKTEELMNKISLTRALPENVAKTVDLTDTLNPLKTAWKELEKAPASHSAEIQSVKNAIKDLITTDLGQKPRILKDISVSDAYEVKKIVSKMQSWKNESEGGKLINSALRETYHNIDNVIDVAVPKLKQLNSRVADMISAGKAIEHRVEILQAQEPANWSSLLNLPFAIYRSPAVKTFLGKVLAQRYKK